MATSAQLLQSLDGLNAQQLKRLLVEQLTRQKLGLYWESNAIERDQALNAQVRKPLPQQSARAPKVPSNTEELMEAFHEAGLRTIRRNAALKMPSRSITEVKPVFEAMALDVQEAVQQLPIEPSLQANAIKAALNRMTEREIYTELFSG